MNLLKCILTENDCYKAGETIKPIGVMVHSTDANNTTLKRYVQPMKTDANYSDLIAKLGKNLYGNHWNKTKGKCAHAFIGTLADGSVATAQTLPWNHRGWHAGGNANNTHISFEICEDNLKDATYFNNVYREAVKLTAMLCKEYNLDPMADGVVICHSEGYKRGIASNHRDVMHWFPKHGKSMDTFRADVKALLNESAAQKEETKDECTVNLPTLKGGCKGEAVKSLQILLIGKNYSCGSYGTDGSFGSATAKAVINFQKANGLTADGIVGPATWTKLLGV